MRKWLCFLLLAAFALPVPAQEPAKEENEKPVAENPDAGAKADDAGKKAKEPEEPPLYSLPEKLHRKLAQLLANYIHPRGKSRKEALDKFEKFLAKPVDGHSALEDVAHIADAARAQRYFGKKLASKRGRTQEVSIAPEVHGFPAIGTVKYVLYLPKGYSEKQLWPLLFCMPNTKAWPDGKSYLEQVWIKRSAKVASDYILVAPRPPTKGEAWSRPKLQARAMISLRHAMGTYDQTTKTGGPAVDPMRVFLDGDDPTAHVAARFTEIVTGAILRGCDGVAVGGPNLRRVGGLNGLPAYCVVDPKKSYQKQFANSLRAKNDACLVVDAEDSRMLGDADAMAAWMAKLPARALAPREIEYVVHDGSFQRHHWINVLEFDATAKPAARFLATADRAKNEIRVEVNGIARFELFLNDAFVDLNRKLRIVLIEDEKEFDFFAGSTEMVARSLATMLEELMASNHAWRIYTAKLYVDLPKIRARVAAEEAAKEAAEEKKVAAGGGADKKPAAEEAAVKKGG